MTTSPNPSGTIVHEIRWSDALPWWLLFRAAAALQAAGLCAAPVAPGFAAD